MLAASCGDSGRHTEPFDIPDEVSGTVSIPQGLQDQVCLFAHGTGAGVEVVTVDPDTPAADSLLPGDVITAADGTPVNRGAELIAIVQTKLIGEVLQLNVSRAGEDDFQANVTLVERPDSPGSPTMGLRIRTAVEMGDARLVDGSGTLESRHSIVVSVGGQLYGVDPLAGSWVDLGAETPDARWIPAAGGIYTIEEGDPDRLVSVAGVDASIPFIVDSWRPQWVLGAQGQLVLVRADRDTETGAESAVFAMDPVTGEVAWEYQPAGSQGNPIPVLAISSPSGDRTLLATTVFDADGNAGPFAYSIVDGEGMLTVPPDGIDIPLGALVIGWHSDDQIAYLDANVEAVLLRNIDDGSLDEVLLPIASDNVQFAPVGDGAHFYVLGAGRIDLISAAADGTLRPLAVNCPTESVSPPGFVT